jgi:hypothetical protein
MSAPDGTHGGDAIRRRAPHVFDAYAETRETVLESGIVERELKELCAAHLAGAVRGTDDAADPARYDERQRAALAWAEAIAWDSDLADDALWARLHGAFSEPELVELGYSIAIMLGQQHWLATLGVAERL